MSPPHLPKILRNPHSSPPFFSHWRSALIVLPFLTPEIFCFSQSRLGSQSDAMVIQSIRNVRGNSFCVDCDAPSKYPRSPSRSTNTQALEQYSTVCNKCTIKSIIRRFYLIIIFLNCVMRSVVIYSVVLLLFCFLICILFSDKLLYISSSSAELVSVTVLSLSNFVFHM